MSSNGRRAFPAALFGGAILAQARPTLDRTAELESSRGGRGSKKRTGPFIFAGQFITRFVWLFRGNTAVQQWGPAGARKATSDAGPGGKPLMVPLDGRLLGNFYTVSIDARERIWRPVTPATTGIDLHIDRRPRRRDRLLPARRRITPTRLPLG